MAEEKPVPLHAQIAHYTGVLQALGSTHHGLRTAGKCSEHGTDITHTDSNVVKAVESTITDVSRLISKLVTAVERDYTPRVN